MMRRAIVTLSKKQIEGLLTLPEETEITRNGQIKIIRAVVKLWQDGKPPEPAEVIESLEIPEKVKANKSQLGEVVRVAQEIASVVTGNGRKPKVFLTKAQVFKAVEQLGAQEKAQLLRCLQAKQERVTKEFATAVERIRETYANLPAKEIKRDVTKALAMVREEQRAKRSYR